MTKKRVVAPITLFVYNRLSHTRQTVEALQKNELAEFSDLFVFADGAKCQKSIVDVNDVREYIKTIGGFKSINIFEHDENFGLANSIIHGVTKLCNEYGRVIVVEDDLVTSPFFLQYMNEALDLYANDSKVASIHGYWYTVEKKTPETFFLRGASCWGWGTWADAWSIFEGNGQKLLDELKNQKLTRSFDLDGAMAYTKMLKDQIKGKNNSWAIRWHASTFLANKLQLSPGRSLVRNIGFDGSGTHSGKTCNFAVELTTKPIDVKYLVPEENNTARDALIEYHIKTRRSIFDRIKGRVYRLINRDK